VGDDIVHQVLADGLGSSVKEVTFLLFDLLKFRISRGLFDLPLFGFLCINLLALSFSFLRSFEFFLFTADQDIDLIFHLACESLSLFSLVFSFFFISQIFWHLGLSLLIRNFVSFLQVSQELIVALSDQVDAAWLAILLEQLAHLNKLLF
jgi:hypothetical protein